MKHNLRPVHGNINLNELRLLGLKKESILDFSANISPLGQPNFVWEAIKSVDLNSYPDPDCIEIREAISAKISTSAFNIPIEKIFIGNGSNEIFHLIFRTILSQNGSALVLTPTYGEYEFACRLAGGIVEKFNADSSNGFKWDFRGVSKLIKDKKPELVIICNPNNPTGFYCDRNEIEILLKASQEVGSIVVIDQAYLSFVEKPWESICLLKNYNIILVRSMSKDYAQTAIRLGYALASANIVSKLRSIQPDWSVNSLAQKTGIYVLNDHDYIDKVRETVFVAKNFLKKEITDLGLETISSDANFIMIKVNSASKCRNLLLKNGVVVRDCSSFGLPNYIRVGIRIIDDCKILVNVMKEVLPLLIEKRN